MALWCDWYFKTVSEITSDEYYECPYGPCDPKACEWCLPEGADCDD